MEEQARQLVAQYTSSHLLSSTMECEAAVIKGDPRQVILETIDKYKPQAVVLGTRGLGMLARTVLGSVSDFVLHNSSSPVIVVREQPAGEQHRTAGGTGRA